MNFEIAEDVKPIRTYKLRYFVSPIGVSFFAEKFREAGIEVFCEGTESVYIKIQTVACDLYEAHAFVLNTLRNTYNSTFGLLTTTPICLPL